MATVSVIYRAPKGDNKVCEWGEFTFFDGVPVEIEENENTAHMIKKMSANRQFELSEMGTVNKPELAPDPEPVPDPDLAPVPEEQPDPEPDPEPVSEPAPDPIRHEFEDYPPEPPKPRKTMTARARTAKVNETPKQRIERRRKRAGW